MICVSDSNELFTSVYRLGGMELKDVECHFKWQPEIKSVKQKKVMIDILKEKVPHVGHHPILAMAYTATLSYLHTCEGSQNFPKARKWLKQLEAIEVQQTDFKLVRDFLYKAISLHIKRLEDGETTFSGDDRKYFMNAWANQQIKALIYAIKGFSLASFGFKNYEEASGVLKEALEMICGFPGKCSSWELFYIQWDCAFCSAKAQKSTFRTSVDGAEKHLWEECYKWLESSTDCEVAERLIDLAEFYSQYADAIIDQDPWRDRKALIDRSVDMLEKMNPVQKKFCKNIFVIAVKLYRRLEKEEVSKRLPKLLEEAESYLGTYGYGYFEISKCFGEDDEQNDKAIDFLKRGKLQMDAICNLFFIDLGLAHRKAKKKCREDLKSGEKWARSKFKSLKEKYKNDVRDVAILLIYESDWLRSLGNLDHFVESIQNLVEAKRIFNETRIPPEHKEVLINTLESYKQDHPEFFAWFASNYSDDLPVSPEEIISLFKSVLPEDSGGKVFAQEHLGCFLLQKNEDFKEAALLFRNLPSTNLNKKFLLSEAVLKLYKTQKAKSDGKPDGELENMLLECLELGNCDVIQPILTLMENRKKSMDLKCALLQPDFHHKDQSQFFFSRKSYETCATIELLMESNNNTFFINKEINLEETFRNDILENVSKFLEIPIETPKDMANIWRRRRLDATKKHITFKGQNLSTEKEYAYNLALMDVLRDSRSPLDRAMKKLFPDKHVYHPFAYKFNNKSKDQKQRMQKMFDMGFEDIKKAIQNAFGDESASTPELQDAIEFMARREHHIAQNEAAWHALWVDAINDDKHNKHLDTAVFEHELNEYRVKRKVQRHMSVYDVAHLAAEFAEQSVIVLNVQPPLGYTSYDRH